MTKAKTATSTSFRKAIDSMTTTTSAGDLETKDESESMNVEVDTAVNFLTCLLNKAQFSMESTSTFRFNLSDLIKRHYHGHWYPNEPLKGSGYRCLRVNAVMHPLLIEAAEVCDFPLKKMRKAFPKELTVWVDPGDVSVRIGEHGSIGVLYVKDSHPSYKRCNPSPLPILNEKKLFSSTTTADVRNPCNIKSPSNESSSDPNVNSLIKTWNDSNLLPFKSNFTSSFTWNQPKNSNIRLHDRCKMAAKLSENVENCPSENFRKESS